MRLRHAGNDSGLSSDLERRINNFGGQAGTVWLDSSDQSVRSLTSLVATDPVGEIRLIEDSLVVRIEDRAITRPGGLADALDELDRLTSTRVAIGQISYEAMLPLVGCRSQHPPEHIPLLHFYLYDAVQASPAAWHDPSSYPRTALDTPGSHDRRGWRCSFGASEYTKAIRAVKRHIAEGDIYQANVTARWQREHAADALEVYRRLRVLNPAPYGAYMNFGTYQVLSSSPELMMRRVGNRLMTSPIKGTVRRSSRQAEDNRLREQLMQSAKDRAEHLMIVDLERNDLGRVAVTGTVCVAPLAALETFASVHHLVSNVHAQVPPDTPNSAILKAILPGGSITGAPKRRAVEILSEIEPSPRGVYTGCLGMIGRGEMHLNIAIRTMTHVDGLWTVAAGGGIVADSDPELEWQETCLKAARLFAALDTLP